MTDWLGTTTFELDLLGRLQKMTDHKGNTVSYAYDAVGNQTSITYPDGSKVSNFYDAVYNLTSVIDAEKGTYVYVYDDANRPVKLTYPNGWVEQYTYDAEGNLLKTVDTDPFQLYNKTPTVKYEYTYYHCDYLGTTDYLTSAVNSKVISWTSYSEWGEITHNAVLKCGQRELDLVKEYATHDFDAVLNMYYAKARFYDADNRRFAAVDPILDPVGYNIRSYVSDPLLLVQYLYVRDNAVNRIDPLGLWTAAISLNGYIAGGWSVGASISLVIDGHGNIGVAIAGSGGAGTPGVGVGAQIAYTNANTIADLGGVGASFGGSILGHGLDLSFGRAGDRSIVTGVAYTPSKLPASWKITSLLSKIGSKVSQLLPTLSSAGSAAELHFLISDTYVKKIFGFGSYYNTIKNYFKTVTCSTAQNVLEYTLGVSL